jgi:cytochrome c-type biogenesis protein CcmH
MTVWFVLALMTAAAIFAVLWPLARQGRTLRSGSDVAVYRDQLDEVERDRAAGRIDEAEAAAAQVEVSRRLLAAADAQAAAATPSVTAGGVALASGVPVAPFGTPSDAWRPRAVAVAALVLLPLGAAALYLALGSPGLPDQPLAPRLAAERQNQSIEALIGQVESHLARNPDDGRGWEVIAPIYLRLGRVEDAVKARRNVLRLNGETAERHAALGETLVYAANGVVTFEAKATFERALALDEGDVKARYFLGLAAEQDGDRPRAVTIWRALIAGVPADLPWVAFVRQALARAEGKPGPTDDDVAAASDLSAEQRGIMIRGMVERLAERLARDGSDVDGWLRLVRSYQVLGEREKALAAVADARRALAGAPDKLRRLDEVAKGQ